ncbi:bifunctional phosphopantothenoylcysteine decarboxylase/phosphopantothenate synthase [Patescibacteria group bacterium]|nr:bifunctional phosphopantothenoylcysteine decarboxylase/phosphopantothenate synthase [Patescibacteria group bacterium]
MKILITAGGTFTPIDQVRGINNIFSGRTGIQIFDHLGQQNEDVVLLLQKKSRQLDNALGLAHFHGITVKTFHTYDDLYNLMKEEITNGGYDVIIHSAAVSDYKVDGIYIDTIPMTGPPGVTYPRYLERLPDVGKQKSNHKELFLRLVQTDKIVDKIRSDWDFRTLLVKFKLEVGLEDEELIKIAKKSRVNSHADIMVANCLEWAKERAYVITEDSVTDIQRDLLPHYLYGEICKLV